MTLPSVLWSATYRVKTTCWKCFSEDTFNPDIARGISFSRTSVKLQRSRAKPMHSPLDSRAFRVWQAQGSMLELCNVMIILQTQKNQYTTVSNHAIMPALLATRLLAGGRSSSSLISRSLSSRSSVEAGLSPLYLVAFGGKTRTRLAGCCRRLNALQ